MSRAAHQTDILFYDGRCPLCRREIALLRRWRRDTLVLTDLNGDLDGLGAPPWATLMRTLHLRRADGRWLTGVEANVAAWSHTPWGWLWAPLRWPPVAPLADRLYAHFARRRLQRRLNCQDCRRSAG